MGEGAVHVVRGAVVSVDIRNVGWVTGTVAWVQDNRFGVAFVDEIDAKLARSPISIGEDPAPHFVRNRPEPKPKEGPLRTTRPDGSRVGKEGCRTWRTRGA